jgi:hypothetical protein
MPAIVSRIRHRFRRAPFVIAPLLVLAAAAGASDIGMAEHWKMPDANRIGFNKVVVIGITTDAAARQRFEDRFVSLLRGRSMQGITSYSIVPDLTNVPDPHKVVEALLADQVDGVFTVRLVPFADKKAWEAWPAAWRAGVESAPTVRAYVEESLARVPPAKVKKHGAEVSVWEVANGRRLWAGRFSPMSIGDLQDNASGMTQDVMTELVFEKVF